MESVLLAVMVRPRRGTTASLVSMPSSVELVLPWRVPLTRENPSLPPSICTPGWEYTASMIGVRASCGNTSMSRKVMAREIDASEDCTRSALASTATLSVTWPISSRMCSTTVPETFKTTLVRTALRNPGASTVTVYSPGGSDGKTYRPSPLVAVCNCTRVLLLTAVISA